MAVLKKKTFSVVDMHTAGEPTRIVSSFPEVKGRSMIEIKEKLETKHDWLRQFLMREPRGHSDMFGAILFPPRRAECDLGVVFMHNGGYLSMCGHGTIGVVACAVKTGMVRPKNEIALDTPAGVVKTRIKHRGRNVESVTYQNVPAFKLMHTTIKSPKELEVDIAFGGNFFALVKAEEAGISIDTTQKRSIIDLGLQIRETVNSQERIVHPEITSINRVELVEFYGPSREEGVHAQNVVVFGQGAIDRSPCGTGTCAKMAVLHSEGKLRIGETFVHESIIHTKFRGRLVSETKVGPYSAVIPEITGSAYITGFNKLIYEENDPLSSGFLL